MEAFELFRQQGHASSPFAKLIFGIQNNAKRLLLYLNNLYRKNVYHWKNGNIFKNHGTKYQHYLRKLIWDLSDTNYDRLNYEKSYLEE